jgi:pilus assembly protein CpaB
VARFSPGTMTAVIFAILIGLGGAYAVRQYLHNPTVAAVAEKPPVIKTQIIPIAGADLSPGRTLLLTDIQIVSMTPTEIAKSKYAGRPFMPSSQQLIGRTLLGEHKKGEPFLPEQFYPEGMGPGVVESLRPGFRAISIPIKNIQAVAGFARPGAMVDVYYRSDAKDGNPEMALTLLERVELLAVGQIAFSGQKVHGEHGSVTVAVTPKQAKALKIVEGKGDLTLALRREEDNMIFPVSMGGSDAMTLEQLLGLPAAQRTLKMDIYRGGTKASLRFDEESQPASGRPRSDLISTPIAAEFPPETRTSSNDDLPSNAALGGS